MKKPQIIKVSSLRKATLDYLEVKPLEKFTYDVNKKKQGILNIKTPMQTSYLANEYRYSRFHQQVFMRLAGKYPKMRKIRGDGNCYFRAVGCLYIERLIMKGGDLLLDFIRNVVDFQHYFLPSSNMMAVFIKRYRPYLVGYLSQLHKELKTAKQEDVIPLFSQMVRLNDDFDRGLIFYLRVSVAQFLRHNDKITIHGLPLTQIYDTNKYFSLEEYIQSVVLKMDTEAQDLVLYCMPLVLRIPILTILIDKDAGGGIHESYYSAVVNESQKHESQEDGLNFHQEEPLTILLKPGHYDALYSKDQARRLIEKQQEYQDGPTQEKDISESTEVSSFASSVAPESGNIMQSQKLPKSSHPSKSKAELSGSLKLTHIVDIKSIQEIRLNCSHIITAAQIIEHFQAQGLSPEIGLQGLLILNPKRRFQVEEPECPRCGQPLSLGCILQLQAKLGWHRFERKEFKNRKEEIIKYRKDIMVDLLCGHVREKAEIRKELDVEFPGAKPRCFFVRDSKYMIKKRPQCSQCLKSRKKAILEDQDLRAIYPYQFSYDDFHDNLRAWDTFTIQKCSICKNEESKKEERLQFMSTEDGSYVHKVCVARYHDIKLSCGHVIQREILSKQVLQKKAQFKEFYFLDLEYNTVNYPSCPQCDKLVPICDLKKILLFSPLVDLKTYEWTIKNILHFRYPVCVFCQKEIKNEKGIKLREESPPRDQIHKACSERAIRLECSHIFQIQTLKEAICNKFNWVPGDYISKLFIQSPEKTSIIRPFCPCCEAYFLSSNELKKIFAVYFDQKEFESMVNFFSAQGIKKCKICKNIIGTTSWFSKGSSYFHRLCAQNLITLRCGHYFRKSEFYEKLKIEGKAQAHDFIKRKGNRMILKDCPNCTAQLTYQDLKMNLSQEIQFTSQELKSIMNKPAEWIQKTCSLCGEIIGLRKFKQLQPYNIVHEQCIADKGIQLHCGCHHFRPELIRYWKESHSLSYLRNQPQKLFILKEEAGVYKGPHCSKCFKFCSIQDLTKIYAISDAQNVAIIQNSLRRLKQGTCFECLKSQRFGEKLIQFNSNKKWIHASCLELNYFQCPLCSNPRRISDFLTAKGIKSPDQSLRHRLSKLINYDHQKMQLNYPECSKCHKQMGREVIFKLCPDIIETELISYQTETKLFNEAHKESLQDAKQESKHSSRSTENSQREEEKIPRDQQINQSIDLNLALQGTLVCVKCKSKELELKQFDRPFSTPYIECQECGSKHCAFCNNKRSLLDSALKCSNLSNYSCALCHKKQCEPALVAQHCLHYCPTMNKTKKNKERDLLKSLMCINCKKYLNASKRCECPMRKLISYPRCPKQYDHKLVLKNNRIECEDCGS